MTVFLENPWYQQNYYAFGLFHTRYPDDVIS